ncbi:hypothetical protein [Paenibacillus jilunlii]|nr:hypothetical protein [Paenibacillus jilunlii]
MNETVIRNFRQEDMAALGGFYQAVTASGPALAYDALTTEDNLPLISASG